jgi:hypothetical protein
MSEPSGIKELCSTWRSDVKGVAKLNSVIGIGIVSAYARNGARSLGVHGTQIVSALTLKNGDVGPRILKPIGARGAVHIKSTRKSVAKMLADIVRFIQKPLRRISAPTDLRFVPKVRSDVRVNEKSAGFGVNVTWINC